MIEWLTDYSEWVLTIAAALVLVSTALRKWLKRGKSTLRKFDLALETLTGRDEIRHPESGEVLAEAQPALGVRLGHMETAIVRLSDTSDAVKSLTHRVDLIGGTLSEHLRSSEQNSVAARREQEAMWKAVEAIANTTPPAQPESQ